MIGKPYPILEEMHMKEEEILLFWFTSHGKQRIRKVIGFVPIIKDGHRYFNWGLGDMNRDEPFDIFNVDDKIQTNNGDIKQVFYTAVWTLQEFFKKYPNAIVHLQGSDLQRMKIYKLLISRHWDIIIEEYSVKMYFNNSITEFDLEMHCDYLLISKPNCSIFD